MTGLGGAMVEGRRPALVAWPEEAARRDVLAEAGVPCLLLVEPGALAPVLAPGEDFAYRTADERDVSFRLERLSRVERPAAAGPLPVLPADLTRDQYRVATVLIASDRRMVPVGDLSVEDPDDVVAALQPVLGQLGLEVIAVGSAGYLLDRAGASPP